MDCSIDIKNCSIITDRTNFSTDRANCCTNRTNCSTDKTNCSTDRTCYSTDRMDYSNDKTAQRFSIDSLLISIFYRKFIDILHFVLSVERTVEYRYKIDEISVLIENL